MHHELSPLGAGTLFVVWGVKSTELKLMLWRFSSGCQPKVLWGVHERCGPNGMVGVAANLGNQQKGHRVKSHVMDRSRREHRWNQAEDEDRSGIRDSTKGALGGGRRPPPSGRAKRAPQVAFGNDTLLQK